MVGTNEKAKGHGHLIEWIVRIGDVCLLNLYFILLHYIVYGIWQPELSVEPVNEFKALSLICLVYFFASMFIQCRLSANIIPADRLVQRSSTFIGLYMVILAAVFTLLNIVYLPISHWIGIAILLSILFSTWHIIFRLVLKIYRKKGYNYKTIILIGGGRNAVDTYRELSVVYTGFKALGYFNDDEISNASLPTYLGATDHILPFLRSNKVDEIYYTLSSENANLSELISYCENNMIRFHLIPNLYQFVKKKLSLQFLETIPVLSLRYEPLQHPFNRMLKRTLDIITSVFVILFVLPIVYIILYPILKLSSPGPIHFVQQRTGFRGHVFNCYKFRSMHQNKDSDNKSATKNDPRITKIGAFMRETSIDELPQFFNVLKGEMSVVGPRPHMLKHTEEYSKLIEKFMVRHLVKPGITGWAQVTGSRGETKCVDDMEERIKKDVWYIENWSLFLDIKIIIKTGINAVLGEDKAY